MQKDKYILQAIADRFDYSLSVVEKVFDRVKSYDETLTILQECSSMEINPLQVSIGKQVAGSNGVGA